MAGVLPDGQRNLAFGLYYAGYGVGWLIGSVATGLLYEQSRLALVLFAVAVQLSSFAAVDPSVQVLDLAIKVRFVVLPCQPIHTGRSVSLECEETGPLD